MDYVEVHCNAVKKLGKHGVIKQITSINNCTSQKMVINRSLIRDFQPYDTIHSRCK